MHYVRKSFLTRITFEETPRVGRLRKIFLLRNTQRRSKSKRSKPKWWWWWWCADHLLTHLLMNYVTFEGIYWWLLNIISHYCKLLQVNNTLLANKVKVKLLWMKQEENKNNYNNLKNIVLCRNYIARKKYSLEHLLKRKAN